MRITKGKILAHRRKNLGVSQKALAERLGCAASVLCKLESGRKEQDQERYAQAHAILDAIEQGN